MIKSFKEGLFVMLLVLACMFAIGAILVILGNMYCFTCVLKGY